MVKSLNDNLLISNCPDQFPSPQPVLQGVSDDKPTCRLPSPYFRIIITYSVTVIRNTNHIVLMYRIVLQKCLFGLEDEIWFIL